LGIWKKKKKDYKGRKMKNKDGQVKHTLRKTM